MRREEFQKTLRASPFRPFRLFTSDGGSYTVEHPEFCILMQRSAMIGYPAPKDSDEGDGYAIVDLAHVTRLELSGELPGGNVPPPSGTETNGPS